MDDSRIQISREEVGLLMSYATRPDRMTKDLIDRMVGGVTGTELLEIAEWIGLPESSAIRLIDANRADEAGTDSGRGMDDRRFRRALGGIIIVMLVLNVAFLIGSEVGAVGVVVLSGAGAAAGYLVYRLIGAISAS